MLEPIYRGDIIVIQIEKEQRAQMQKRLEYLSERNATLEKKIDSCPNQSCNHPSSRGDLGHVG